MLVPLSSVAPVQEHVAEQHLQLPQQDERVLSLRLANPLLQTAPNQTASKQYGIIVDAGSSGSRIHLYSWPDHRHVASKQQSHRLPIIEKADKSGRHFQLKVEPGISSFVGKHEQISAYLKPLLDFAAQNIPQFKHSETPIYLYATAGMRLVSPEKQKLIFASACAFVQSNYAFSVADGCENHFRVISGELEGIFGWLTVNYLKGGLNLDDPASIHSIGSAQTPQNAHSRSFGFLDMGGASAQIAFEPTPQMAKLHANDLWPIRVRFLDGSESVFHIFVSTFLGFGSNQARKRSIDELIKRHLQRDKSAATRQLIESLRVYPRDLSSQTQQELDSIETAPTVPPPQGIPISNNNDEQKQSFQTTQPLISTESNATNANQTSAPQTLVIRDPCIPLGLSLNITHDYDPVGTLPLTLIGTGSYNDCMNIIKPLLNKHIPCPEEPCLFNGVHAPIADFQNHRFLGVSEFWYTSFEVFELGGAYNYSKLASATESYCQTPWHDIMQRHSSDPYPNVDNIERLKQQCFKSSWIISVLHDGFGLPMTPKQTSTQSLDASVHEPPHPDPKSPLFESVDEIGEFSLSWTLGAIFLYVSATIPPSQSRSAFGLGTNGIFDRIATRSDTSESMFNLRTIRFVMIISISSALTVILILQIHRRLGLRRPRRNSNDWQMPIYRPQYEIETTRIGIGVATMRSAPDRQEYD